MLSLLAIGAIMVQSASSGITGDLQMAMVDPGGQASAICRSRRPSRFCSSGALIMPGWRGSAFAASRRRSSGRCCIAIVLCTAVLVPGIGVQINGARRWIRLGPVQLQPSELAKWAVVLFLAYWLTFKPPGDRFFGGFLADAHSDWRPLPAGGDPGFRHRRADRASARFTMLLAGR